MSNEFNADIGQQMDQLLAGMDDVAKMIKTYYDSLIKNGISNALAERMAQDFALNFWRNVGYDKQ